MRITSARMPERAFCLSASNFKSSSLKYVTRLGGFKYGAKTQANSLAKGSFCVLFALRGNLAGRLGGCDSVWGGGKVMGIVKFLEYFGARLFASLLLLREKKNGVSAWNNKASW